MIRSIGQWLGRRYQLTVRIAAFLFALQLIHLVWLTSDVVALRLFGVDFFPDGLDFLVALVDYTEIPALISVSLVYLNDIFAGRQTKRTWLFLIFLNIQWLHLLWITDEVVVQSLTGSAPVAIPAWLAWVAILIDYLELPVMVDTVAKALKLRNAS